ncbi:MAG: acyltransferase [Rhodobiaceae bacterium]|nr:acyltransferase [Rhodobiaceae bacterium]MCC0055660.1 acyltransferase [Rhodobiaceae bacterium]
MIPERRSDYRPYIDGLRAISILSVVGYHIGLPGFSGGFVGVDVFFVISGYLIIGQLVEDRRRGDFSIMTFYARRSLRILPPYLLMVALVCIVAPIFLITLRSYEDFARAAISAPLMLSNLIFYLKQGYFDIDSLEKPLLHTWTLSVEEQFYLAAPLTILLLSKMFGGTIGRRAFAVACLLALISFVGCVMRTDLGEKNPAFYAPHWRAWEFIIGGLAGTSAAFIFNRVPRIVSELVTIAGVAAIIFAIVCFSEDMEYPSWRPLVPVAGAALILMAGRAGASPMTTGILGLRPMAWIGLISYSWYLWHWPVLSYMRIHRGGVVDLPVDATVGGILGLALAIASYRFVELPARGLRHRLGHDLSARKVVLIAVLACAATAGLGGLASLASYKYSEYRIEKTYHTEGRGTLNNGCRLLALHELPAHCIEGDYGIILGDSTANALYESLARHYDERGITLVAVARGGCNVLLFTPENQRKRRDHQCYNLVPMLQAILKSPNKPRFVIIHSRALSTKRGTEGDLEALIRQFDLTTTRILLVAPAPWFGESSLTCVILADRQKADWSTCDSTRAENDKWQKEAAETMADVASKLPNTRFVDPMNVFCDDTTCRPYRGKVLLFEDHTHVMPSGADAIIDAFADDFEWAAEGGGSEPKR